MHSVLNKLSEYIHFYISKNISSYAFLFVFKIAESLRSILKQSFFRNSFFPSSMIEWDKIDCNIRKYEYFQWEDFKIHRANGKNHFDFHIIRVRLLDCNLVLAIFLIINSNMASKILSDPFNFHFLLQMR